MSRPFLSLVAIARNEEAVVARFINSIREYLGPKVEIVIVDTGSTDKTVEIARSMGAKVFEEGEKFAHIITEEEERFINCKFNDEVIKKGQRLFFYSDARNCADSHATGEWLFSLDLHWILTSGKELEKKLRSLPATTTTCSYRVTLGSGLFSTTRIYRKGCGLWRHRIHEIFEPASGSVITIDEIGARKVDGAPHNYLPHLAYHYYYGQFNDNEYARMIFYFSREVYYNADKYPTLALELVRKCAHNNFNWIKERSQAAIFMSNLVSDLNEKRQYLNMAIAMDPIWREPYLLLADVAYKQCDWVGCIGYAEQAMKIEKQEGPLHIERQCNYTTEPYRLIYVAQIQMIRICRQKKYYARAIDRIEECLRIEKKTGCSNIVFIPLWTQAYHCYKAVGNNGKAEKMFQLCKNANPEKYKEVSDM